MAEQATESSGSGNKWLGLIVGLVLVGLGSTVFKDLQVPIPGLDLNLGKSAAMAGIAILLFPLIRMFYTDPLKTAINERNAQLEETFTEAEELRQRMDEMRGEYEQRLSAAEAAAREQIQAQIREAQALRDQLRSEAVQQAEQFKAKALADIEQEKQRILNDLRVHVVNLTLQATEKLVGESVDNERSRKLIDEFIEQVEVAG